MSSMVVNSGIAVWRLAMGTELSSVLYAMQIRKLIPASTTSVEVQ